MLTGSTTGRQHQGIATGAFGGTLGRARRLESKTQVFLEMHDGNACGQARGRSHDQKIPVRYPVVAGVTAPVDLGIAGIRRA